MSFGDVWGGSWGGGTPGAAFAIALGRAVNNRQIAIAFTDDPRQLSPIGDYDALNPANWTVVDSMTGETLVVISVSSVPGDTSSVVLTLLTGLNLNEDYVITVGPAVLSAAGFPLTTPTSVTILGLAAVQGDPTNTLIDIQNVQTQPGAIGGALSTTSAGGYATESGTDLLQKIVDRQVTTAVGSFYHDPSFGLLPTTGVPYNASSLVQLRNTLQQGIAGNPEFSSVEVALSMTTGGFVNVAVSAVLVSTGQLVTVTTAIGGSGG